MTKRISKFGVIAILAIFSVSGQVIAQNKALTISKEEKKQVIDSVAKFMTDYYVFPDIGKQIADGVIKKHKKGVYKPAKTYFEFSELLNKDLLSINNDKHIGMRYVPERIKMMKESNKNKDDNFEKYELLRQKNRNFGFKEVKILTGNIGYIKLNGFTDADVGGNTAIATMNFLTNTKAIIFDLTDNGGGSPSMIQLITSYFFEDSEHLNSFYYRDGDITKQFWTQAVVQGPKMINTDLYVLTSSRTFSAAEEFTYNLKSMERATIVGETTGGGAHPVSSYLINDNFTIQIPFGRAINPITKTNWEGTGIKPHIEVSRDKALNTAWLTALEKLEKKEENELIRKTYTWAIDGLNAKLNPITIDKKILETYAGKYGPRNIIFENGELFYQRENRPKYKMIPIKEDYFGFEEIEYFRLKIIKEKNKVVAVEGHYDNGRMDKNEKSK